MAASREVFLGSGFKLERLESKGKDQARIEKQKNKDRKSFPGTLMHQSSESWVRGVVGLKTIQRPVITCFVVQVREWVGSPAWLVKIAGKKFVSRFAKKAGNIERNWSNKHRANKHIQPTHLPPLSGYLSPQ